MNTNSVTQIDAIEKPLTPLEMRALLSKFGFRLTEDEDFVYLSYGGMKAVCVFNATHATPSDIIRGAQDYLEGRLK
jgi:hypothetical protein